MENRERLMNNIIDRLSYLQSKIKNRNSLNLTDANIHAENFFRDFFNQLGSSFDNENYSQPNSAYIDLIDKTNKIAIQVTSQNTNKKITDCVIGFYKNEKYKDYKLKVLLIAKDAKDYKFNKEVCQYTFEVIDIKKIISEINDRTLDDLNSIASFLDKQIFIDRSDVPKVQDFTDFSNIKLSHYNNIDFLKKDNIVKRSEIAMKSIAEIFQKNRNKDSSIVKPILLRSWSGEGKTTIAIEFAYIFGAQFMATLWIDSSKSIGSQFVDFANPNHLNLNFSDSLKDSELREMQIAGVKDYINKHPVLIIFDNIEDLSKIERFLPKTGMARVIAITTNFNLKIDEYFKEIELPKLNDTEALQILFQSIQFDKSEYQLAIDIAHVFDNSPFALELANSYLKELQNVKLSEFYYTIKSETIKWAGVKEGKRFKFIHNIPSVIVLIELKLGRLDETSEIDELSKVILSIIGCLEISGDSFDFDILRNISGLKEETTDNSIIFNKVSNRLSELGLVKISNNKFIVHSLTLEYLKHLYIQKSLLKNVIENKFIQSNQTIKMEMQMGIWFGDSLNNILKIEKLVNKFENICDGQKDDLNILAELNLFLFDKFSHYFNFPFFENRSKILDYINKVIQFAEDDKEFKHYQRRIDNFLYDKAITLHKLKKYEEASEIYFKLLDGTTKLPLINLINCVLMVGHYCRFKNNFENAIKKYDLAIDYSSKMFSEDKISKSSFLLIEFRANLYKSRCYKHLNDRANFENVVSICEKKREELWDSLPNSFEKHMAESLPKNNPKRNPIEVALEMKNFDSIEPLSLTLGFIEVKDIE
jgi:hypothetical protein